MAIGTALAVGAAVGGSVLGASSQKKAAKKAADTSLAVAEKNNALAREIYGKNEQALSPFMGRGNVAGDYINAFLGLPSAPQPQAQAATPTGQTPMGGNGVQNGFLGAALGSGMFNAPSNAPQWGAYQDQYGDGWYLKWLQDRKNGVPQATGQAPQQPGNVTTPAGVTQQNAQDAFRNYIANSDYGFQFGEGSNAVNSGYAGVGTLQSGEAMKAMEDYRQNLQSGYRNEYMGYLGNQQGVGLSGASALAGVGQNYVGTVSANNQNAGDAVANAALIRGQNNPFAAGLGALSGTILGGGS